MATGIANIIFDLIHQYGYVALFVYLMLETAFILHFAPSELVVPVAASVLVHDPFTFALFVIDATAGATAGSLLLYWIFDRYGETTLDRYGRYLHLSETRIDRSQRWFQHWGESTVLWGRFLPLMRAVISIPAGIAHMERRKFAAYSALGAAVFNTVLTYLVYTGSQTNSPLDLVIQPLVQELTEYVAYARTHRQLLAVVGILVLLVVGISWWQRDWIETHPETSVLIGLHVVRLSGVTTGVLVITSAFVSPQAAFRTLTWVWDDPRFLLQFGFSPQLALALTGTVGVVGGIVVFELGTRLLDASRRFQRLVAVFLPSTS